MKLSIALVACMLIATAFTGGVFGARRPLYTAYASDECTTALQGFKDLIPSLTAHLDSGNVLALGADAAKIFGMISSFKGKCVSESADCQSKLNAWTSQIDTVLGDLKNRDQAGLKKDGAAIVGAFMDYRGSCLVPQNIEEFFWAMANGALKVHKHYLNEIVMTNWAATDACTSDLDTLFGAIPRLEQHLKDQNVFGLIGDYNSLSGAVNHFGDHCMSTTPECTQAQADLKAKGLGLVDLIISNDKAGMLKAADVIVDATFSWYHKCTGPQ